MMERRDSGDIQLVIDEDACESHTISTNSACDTDILMVDVNAGEITQIPQDVSTQPKAPGKSKSKQKKSTTPSTPKQPKPFKRIQTFKLNTIRSMKNTSLNIAANLNEFYNMKLFLLSGNVLMAEVEDKYPARPPLPEISLKQLLNWPGLAVTLTLRDITYTRRLLPNYDRAIVFGTDHFVGLDQSENFTDTRHMSQTNSNKYGMLISKRVFDMYIGAISDILHASDVSKVRIQEIQFIFNRIKSDLTQLSSLYLKTSFSQFCSKKKFMRIIDHKLPPESSKQRKFLDVHLREVTNPEIQFSVERCTFLNETGTLWEKDFIEYFDQLLVHRAPESLNAFKEMLKRCLVFECMLCNTSFDGVLCIHAVKAHLSKHFYERNWACLNCHESMSQFDLAEANWAHVCSDIEN